MHRLVANVVENNSINLVYQYALKDFWKMNFINSLINEHLHGQGPFVQCRRRKLSPVQMSPPNIGAGFVQLLVSSRTPSPQVVLQDVLDQSLHPPST